MAFDFDASMRRAEERLGAEHARSSRSDRGVTRLDAAVVALVEAELMGGERPDFKAMHAMLVERCRGLGLSPPSRSSLYGLIERAPGHVYRVRELPVYVRETLHNVEESAEVSGRQVAFASINYGDTRALAFAAALPWLDLHQARGLRGYREKSRGLLEAICLARGI